MNGESLARIAEEELRFTYSRSSGPGGQNVNRVETRVTLLFDVHGSECLSEPQKYRIAGRLATRINRDGILRVVSQRHRTREANRRAAVERFDELLTEALKPTKKRIATRVRRSAVEKRIRQKKERGRVKQGRRRVAEND